MPPAAATLPAAATPFADVRGILLDVDGTLYDQRGLRLAMLARLLRFAAGSPRRGATTLRALRAYRPAQEHRRACPPADDRPVDVATAQVAEAARRSGLPEAAVRDAVARWMEREPLDLLARNARPGLAGFLRAAAARAVPVGVVSDYRAAEKLEALGVAELVRCVVCAQDADVGCFKPHPRGLVVGAQRLGLAPASVLYVGDRASVDGAAAAAAGMRCVIVGAGRDPAAPSRVADFAELERLVFPA